MVNENEMRDDRSRIYLQPIAAPSILGLYGFAGATFMVAAHMAHWAGTSNTMYVIPFAAIFGGVAQFLAGMWAYKARDGVATAMHGLWGSFWIAYGILNLLVLAGKLAQPAVPSPEMGYWFIVTAAITWAGVIGAAAQSRALVTVLTFLAAASTAAAIDEFIGTDWLMILAGWLFIAASIAAWYTATALMLEESHGHSVWALGKARHAREMPAVSSGIGEPGVIRGQA